MPQPSAQCSLPAPALSGYSEGAATGLSYRPSEDPYSQLACAIAQIEQVRPGVVSLMQVNDRTRKGNSIRFVICALVSIDRESLDGQPIMTNSKRNPSGHAGHAVEAREVSIPPLRLPGTLRIPSGAKSIVAFAHGSGSSRLSPRNMAVAEALNGHRIATLLFDLLTFEEEADRANVFDIPLLAERLVQAVRWLDREPDVSRLPLGLFGASTGAAAALVAAAKLGERVQAVVSRGGRPDLAGNALEQVRTPTLLIVGGTDLMVIELNQEALTRLRGPKALEIVPGASHLFPERGALEAVIDHAAGWFERHLVSSAPGRARAFGEA